MSNENVRRIYRVVHAGIPEEWELLSPRPAIVQEVSKTDYLLEDVPFGAEVILGGVNLFDCVINHLKALAKRSPVVDGRVSICLSLSATLQWNWAEDKYGHCSLQDFEDVVDAIMRETGVKVGLVD